MKRTNTAFTLVEVLVVVGIIAALTAILFPVFGSVQKSGRRTTSVSNLRQCGLALRMYFEEYGGDDVLPSYPVAKALLKSAPTCDPQDNWRSSCSEDFGSPLIGSYAYVGAIKNISDEEGWQFYKNMSNNNPTLLMSIYYATEK